MKIKIFLLTIILCMAGTSPLAARGDIPGKSGGNSHGGQGGKKDKGTGVYIDVPGALLLGKRYIYPPAGAGGYGGPYQGYDPGVAASQPNICIEERTVYGDGGQIGREEGRRFWTTSPYPVIKRVQVPCQ